MSDLIHTLEIRDTLTSQTAALQQIGGSFSRFIENINIISLYFTALNHPPSQKKPHGNCHIL